MNPLCLFAFPVAVVSAIQCFACYGPTDPIIEELYPHQLTTTQHPQRCQEVINASELVICPKKMNYCVEAMVGPNVYKGCGDERFENMTDCVGAAHPVLAVPIMMCSCNVSYCNQHFQEFPTPPEAPSPEPYIMDPDYFYSDSAIRLRSLSGVIIILLVNMLR